MPLKIIYLDDEADLCTLFQLAFESDQVVIQTFINPPDAILEANKGNCDLIILDYRLPHTNGDLVAMQMDPKIPKILITGDLNVVPETSFLRIFYKPFKVQEIEDFLQSFAT